MYAKIQITGKIEVVTGMHIGGSDAISAIGAVDSPIMKDARTRLPLLPGSSLKGKMRTLLAKEYNSKLAEKPDDDAERIIRLFGTSKKDSNKRIIQGRLIFSDMIMENAEELRKQGVQSITEVKFENNINRLTAIANPRQIERAIRGTVFPLDIIYNMNDEVSNDILLEDMETIAEGMKLLEYDYIGGNGTRGYGKVKFSDITLAPVVGQVEASLMDKCKKVFEMV